MNWVREILDNGEVCEALKAVSSWADDQPETGAYHFVNSNRDCSPYNEATDCGDPTSSKCLVTGLTKYVKMAVSESSSSEDLPVALKMIIHLMVDLHQPMHLGFAEDHGGNDMHLNRPVGLNLHEVWDSYLTSELHIGDLLKMSAPSDLGVVDVLDPLSVHEYIAGIVSSVSATYTCPVAYKDNGAWIVTLSKLSKDYLSSRPVSATRLLHTAGMRLGSLLNRIGKVWVDRERELNPRAPHVLVEEITAQVDPNRFSVLEVDEVDLDEMLRYQESKEPPSVDVIEPSRHVVDGVDISEVVLLRDPLGSGLHLVTFKGVDPHNVLRPKMLTFHDSGDKVFRLMFDTDMFPGDLEVRAELYKAVLARLQGKSRTKGGPILPSATSSVPNIHDAGDFGIIRTALPQDTRFHTLLGDTLYVKNGYFHPDAATHLKYMKRREVFAKLGQASSPTPDEVLAEAEQLDLFGMAQIRRKCGSLVRVSVDGFILYALRASLVSPPGTAVRPLTVIAHNLQLATGGIVAVAIDAKLLETPMPTPRVQQTIKACFDGLLPERPGSFYLENRPTMNTEIREVYAYIRGIQPTTNIVKTLVTYSHPSLIAFGGIVIEWTV
jgi:hypothetical protein